MAGVKHSLSVDLQGVQLPAPVVTAAGCFGLPREGAGVVDVRRLGGIVTRSLSAEPSRGSRAPRLAEAPSGLITAIGAQNPGVDAFVAEELPRLARTGLPLIGSVAGGTLEEYIRVTRALQDRPEIVALELYLATPDREHRGEPFYARLSRVSEVVGAVSRLSDLPVFVKLPALLPDLVETAKACVRAGAHGLTLIDAVPAMAIDVARLRPRLGAVIGALSGPAIRPIALACVYRVASALPNLPLMGVGGISSGDDAVEFLLAGAWAVQVGTATLVNPSAPAEVLAGILAYLRDKGISSPGDLRGRVRVGLETTS